MEEETCHLYYEDEEGFVVTAMRTGHWVELGAAENTEFAGAMTVNLY